MSKSKTLQIQDEIQKLGERLGFISKIEEQLHSHEYYAPKYDVVWELDLEKQYNLSDIRKLFMNDVKLFERIKCFPFAGFEIEGSSTTSKNQLGNFANLYSGNFLYNFVIVNNSEANGENDTYRRGVKLKRYFSENSGDKNVFFFDKCHLEQSVDNLIDFDKELFYDSENLEERGTYGGESESTVMLYEKIRTRFLMNSGLSFKQNYSPWLYDVKYQMAKEASGKILEPDFRTEDCFRHFYTGQVFYREPLDTKAVRVKKLAESLYVPKLDICGGFNAPKGFTAWLKALADVIGNNGVAHFPILYALQRKMIEDLFVPLIGIEIEANVNKHLNGGIFNMAKNTYAGVVVTKEPALKHVEFYKKELGIKNITAYCLEE